MVAMTSQFTGTGPATMLRDLVAHAPRVAQQAAGILAPLAQSRDVLRSRLLGEGLIGVVPDDPPPPPRTMAAIDGARVVERMYGADLVAAVAISAEALIAETSGETQTATWAGVFPHAPEIDRIAGFAMAAAEMKVAARSQHVVRILDGSFVTPLMEIRKGLKSRNPVVRDSIVQIAEEMDFVGSLRSVTTPVAGKCVVAAPKSETSRAFGEMFAHRYGVEVDANDRLLATQFLEGGEVLSPRGLVEIARMRLASAPDASAKEQGLVDAVNGEVDRLAGLAQEGLLATTYVRPVGVDTVLRFEFFRPSVEDSRDMFQIASWLLEETPSPHSLEPYCQWSADKQAKDISSGAKALRADLSSHLSPEQRHSWGGLLAQNYRT